MSFDLGAKHIQRNKGSVSPSQTISNPYVVNSPLVQSFSRKSEGLAVAESPVSSADMHLKLDRQESKVESLVSSEDKRKLEETRCSTKGATSCLSQIKKPVVHKASYFGRAFNQVHNDVTLEGLKLSSSTNKQLDGQNTSELYFLKEDLSDSEEINNSNSSLCSECSDVELFLENNSNSSSNLIIKPKNLNENAAWADTARWNLSIDEPSFSSSSSCEFSFEYLKEDYVIAEVQDDLSPDSVSIVTDIGGNHVRKYSYNSMESIISRELDSPRNLIGRNLEYVQPRFLTESYARCSMQKLENAQAKYLQKEVCSLSIKSYKRTFSHNVLPSL